MELVWAPNMNLLQDLFLLQARGRRCVQEGREEREKKGREWFCLGHVGGGGREGGCAQGVCGGEGEGGASFASVGGKSRLRE